MKNWATYTALILLAIILFMLFKMNKTINLQNTVLAGIAGKLGVENQKEQEDDTRKEEVELPEQETPEEKELREENELAKAMVEISDRIKNNEIISEQDAQYYKNNFDDMHENLQLTDPLKIIEGQPDDGNTERKQLSRDEKKAFVIELFKDTPLRLDTISRDIARVSGIKPNKGNTSVLLKEMIEDDKIISYRLKNSIEAYYVLPEWMDGKKLKQEFLQKIK